MEGRHTGQVRHGCATTTHAIRAAIERSQASNAELSRELGINPKTVAKWRQRQSGEDRKTGPIEPRSTVPGEEDEAVVVAFRRHTLPPLDDRLYALQPTIPYPIRGTAETTRAKLVAQARLQHARKTEAPAYGLRAPEPGKGFDLLPEPTPGDVFYEIEGDPHYAGGLEYLHGVWCDGDSHAFWAHDHEAEAQALSELLAFFRARLDAHPEARIYHYAPYEITALRRLTTKYGIGEAFLDRLLLERRFVDLDAVVRGGLICSEANYSIKSMEAFYGRKRDGEITTAGGSPCLRMVRPAEANATGYSNHSLRAKSTGRMSGYDSHG